MSTMLPKKIAVLPGDGIGVEVTHEATKVFSALDIPVELCFGDIGWEFWKSEGTPIPQRTWDLIESCDVTLLGAITSMPKREALAALPSALRDKNIEYVSPIIQLRQKLDLYANLRPCFNIKGSSKDFNFAVIRENTEGLYAGFDYHPIPSELHPLLESHPRWSKQDFNEISASLRLQSKAGLLRLFNFAFKHAHDNNFKRVTLADKPNVLRQSSAFARECFESVANQYPHIEADILNVDAVSLWMVRRPEEFGVIVAENMFGDILSDLGAGVMGGLGFAPSANIGEKGAYFEPVHGSAPRVAAGNANPSAMFLTCAMLLRHLGFNEKAARIQQAVKQVVKIGKHLTYDLGGKATTAEMAKAIIDATMTINQQKTIAFLATGSELLNGDLQENNAHLASKIIHEAGGNVRTKMLVSDDLKDIKHQLLHLLNDNDAVITIGGLGPTSDDNTRFAISESSQLTLELDEASWTHVQDRLKKFGLNVTESNRQQALFPKTATIWKNEFGTANACHLHWQGRDIFMLPGPPKEYLPLFEQKVMPYLEQANYFNARKAYRYLTLGLIEGEISSQVDAIAKKYQIATAYRWHYPYLEIKLISDQEVDAKGLGEIESLLRENVVSTDGSDVEKKLGSILNALNQPIMVHTSPATQTILNKFKCQNLIFTDNTAQNSLVQFDVLWPSDEDSKKVVQFNILGIEQGNVVFQHQAKAPMRENDIDNYIRSYFAWQLSLFINLKSKGH